MPRWYDVRECDIVKCEAGLLLRPLVVPSER